MTLAIPIPDDLEELLRKRLGGDLTSYAREALAVELYRDGKIHHIQFAGFLGLDRWQAEEILHRQGVVDLTTEDPDRDDKVIRKHLGL